MNIARSILDLGIKRKELKESDNLGKKLRNVIIENYQNDRQKYKARLSKMIEKASKNNVDIMILPALSFVCSKGEKAADYLNMCKNIPWVIAGKLEIREGRSKETCVIIEEGEAIQEINDSTALGINLNGIDSRVAISSTIKEIRDGSVEISEIKPCKKNPDYIFAFDIGHEQYTGRYKRTLKSIVKVLDREAVSGAAIILTYWKYIHASSYYYWCEKLRGLNIEVDREYLNIKNSNKKDYFDIIKVSQEEVNDMRRKELTKDVDEIKENMKRFERAFKEGKSEITDKLSQFKRWYYNEKLDIFAPSKFIGYKDMTPETYDSIYKNIDGRETEKILKDLSNEVKDESKREKLLRELDARLSEFDKKINKAASVRIID